MRNHAGEAVDEEPGRAQPRRAGPHPEPAPPPSPAPPLVILAADDDAVCVDDLCLPADARS